ncbi:granulocyte-macrophage colony-stimulating factor receptor subunit alpha-like [Apteryx rowi]|uniref:granulocyte-macrophage colony-stimulating factor receptor subunit alpha-like n=1 Tax=Apteryx rowi TaxID=308060 RepID=UPI000E1CE58F|nr:granulocyte-macrophage colony-stimulating factor receptor subunit alpha-like [Apteryx rowi]XP_025910750.1 granulocyte-macrophage colony-stimulating factor receptor subunit alpha-like [Apteryx rowi]
MVAPLGLIFMIQWMLLFAPVCGGWRCTDLEMPDSPIRNLTLNRRKMEMSWVSSMNFTEYSCSVNAGDGEIKIKVKDTTCMFERNMAPPLHNGANFSVTAVNINTTYSSICTFIPQGMPGTAITNFSCVIYNVSLMNCTWHAGRDAPGDTQYFLYWQNSGEEEERECELYVKDENGRHTGCQFQNVMIKDTTTYFMVNGSSKDSLIRFHDEYIKLYTIEKLMPPLNVTINCDGIQKGCIIQWQRPQISHSSKDECFKYEVDIKHKANPEEKTKDTYITERKNNYSFQNFNTKKRYLVKIRAAGSACLVNTAWGEWSAPLEFGNEEVISPSMLILLLTVVATLLVAVLTVLFCKRTGYWKAAFPQIPEPKNAFHVLPDTALKTECEMQSITPETEEIIVLAEVMK